jgi:REP element-mobilizing transposase RayT
MRTRKRNRLRNYDYRTAGAYFITTVVRGRQNTFGEVKDGVNHLTPYGETLVEQWHWLHKQYLHIMLDQFVVMPNHFHGIIIIVGTGRDLHLQPKTKSLSELIGAFKTTSSRRIHQLGMPSFQWQRSFYERIIRNDDELRRIREYIQTNPLRWDLDIENCNPGVSRGCLKGFPQDGSVQHYYDDILQG